LNEDGSLSVKPKILKGSRASSLQSEFIKNYPHAQLRWFSYKDLEMLSAFPLPVTG